MSPLQPNRQFQEAVREGYKWQLWLAAKLRENGIETVVPGLKVAMNPGEIDECSDGGDVHANYQGHWRIVEVKSRNLSFRSRELYPYPTGYVDRQETWDKKKAAGKQAEIGFYVSTVTKAVIALDYVRTEPLWKITMTTHPFRPGREPTYEIGIEEFIDFEEAVAFMKTGQVVKKPEPKKEPALSQKAYENEWCEKVCMLTKGMWEVGCKVQTPCPKYGTMKEVE